MVDHSKTLGHEKVIDHPTAYKIATLNLQEIFYQMKMLTRVVMLHNNNFLLFLFLNR